MQVASGPTIPDSIVLLVEDNEDDVFIFNRIMRKSALPHRVQVVRDGQEALDYVGGVGIYRDRAQHPLPFLVLLDLKLPLKGGLDVLQSLRARPEWCGIPVVVLTSSAERRDILRAFQLGARAFLVKPPSETSLREIIGALGPDSSGPVKISGDQFRDWSLFGDAQSERT